MANLNLGRASAAIRLGFDFLGNRKKSKNIKDQSGLQALKTVSGYSQAKTEQIQGLSSIVEDYVNQKDFNSWLSGYKGDSMADDAALISDMNLDKSMTTTVRNVMNNIRKFNEARDLDLKVIDTNRANAELENMFSLGGSILEFAEGWLNEK